MIRGLFCYVNTRPLSSGSYLEYRPKRRFRFHHPSGTENIYKIYAEGFRGADHLRSIMKEAQSIVDDAIGVSVKKKS